VGAVPGLDPATVQLVLAPATIAATVAPTLTSLGPFQVAAESRRPLVVVAFAALALFFLLGVGLFWTAAHLARRLPSGAGSTRET
jgi:hypothetical protein